MAKKKTDEKSETKTETKNNYDFQSQLNEMEIPDSLKAGFKYYININNITIKSENDLKRELTKFEKLNAGA